MGQIGEGDLTACDQSEDSAALSVVDMIAEIIGVSQEARHEWWTAYSAPYTIRTPTMVIKGEAGVQMPTGVSITTVGNSLMVATAFIGAIREAQEHGPGFSVEEYFLSLGYTLKYKSHDFLFKATFLRGWFCPDERNEYVWMPLPSACLKIGKLFRDPRLLVVGGGLNAAKVVAHAIASSYPGFDYSYPIFGEWLRTMRRLGIVGQIRDGDFFENPFRVRSAADVKINREGILLMIEGRYGITPADVERVEKLLRSVETLPAYVEDPVFSRLSEVDY